MRARLCGPIAVLLLLAAGPAAAAAAPATKRCADDKRARCGSIRVPLLRGAPDGGGAKLRVYFRVFPRTDRSTPALEPIVTVEGGPGYPSIDSADSYLFMLGRLRRRHDMIVMDNRGTGRSGAINCKRLQAGKGDYAREVGRCARLLGRRANAYGTGAAADDLAAVLDKLGVPVVDIYGDSYGSYFAQAFAVRHRARVRAVVLDATYPVEGFDPWARNEPTALRFAWPATCMRSTGCGGVDALAELRFWSERLQARPLVATGRDADGARHRILLDGSALGQMAGDGSYYYTIYRDLLAALRAYKRGDRGPLVRLAAEDLPFTGGGPVKSYSEGLYAAVACHDYPTIWDPAASFAERRRQLTAARTLIDPDDFAPFPKDIWLRSLYIDQLVRGCLRWPAARYPDPPVPPGASYPRMPVLALDGDLDAITPLDDSVAAAELFPNSTLVTVPNVGHVTALADYPDCASEIVRRFLETLQPGDTSCTQQTPEVHVVPEFPRRLRAAPQADPAGSGDNSTKRDRRAAWAASWAVGDSLARWWLMYGSDGHGLRGGTFTASGEYLAYTPVRLRMRRVQFVPGLGVSGRVIWNRRAGNVRAELRLSGIHRGRLRIAWRTQALRSVASLSGRVGGHRVRLQTPAP
ncbi:MAG TPA: alpha/beta hydrolase [Thermoleophilaceae bacterium]|nr:alpha/beta hydrolase [Thermoleophilaceae bacterium]